MLIPTAEAALQKPRFPLMDLILNVKAYHYRTLDVNRNYGSYFFLVPHEMVFDRLM